MADRLLQSFELFAEEGWRLHLERTFAFFSALKFLSICIVNCVGVSLGVLANDLLSGLLFNSLTHF